MAVAFDVRSVQHAAKRRGRVVQNCSRATLSQIGTTSRIRHSPYAAGSLQLLDLRSLAAATPLLDARANAVPVLRIRAEPTRRTVNEA
jgi:hypothetical protein